MDLPLRALALVLEEELGRLTALLRRLRTLHDVVVLGLAHRPPLVISDVVIQDEFTHDVVLPLAPDRFLVFDTTWLGGLTAVAVWDHAPTADELLADRLAQGWRPTPTATVEGPRVLGHAACAILPPPDPDP